MYSIQAETLTLEAQRCRISLHKSASPSGHSTLFALMIQSCIKNLNSSLTLSYLHHHFLLVSSSLYYFLSFLVASNDLPPGPRPTWWFHFRCRGFRLRRLGLRRVVRVVVVFVVAPAPVLQGLQGIALLLPLKWLEDWLRSNPQSDVEKWHPTKIERWSMMKYTIFFGGMHTFQRTHEGMEQG